MFANTLTAEVWAEIQVMSPKVANAMKKDTQYKSVILQFEQAENAPLIAVAEAYENGELFTIGGKSVEFFEVVEIALNSLTYRKQNPEYEAHSAKFPAIYARKSEAWTILNNIQAGYEAQGKKFSHKTEDLRALVEARLA